MIWSVDITFLHPVVSFPFLNLFIYLLLIRVFNILVHYCISSALYNLLTYLGAGWYLGIVLGIGFKQNWFWGLVTPKGQKSPFFIRMANGLYDNSLLLHKPICWLYLLNHTVLWCIVCCRLIVLRWLNTTAMNIYSKDFHCFLITRLIRLLLSHVLSLTTYIFWHLYVNRAHEWKLRLCKKGGLCGSQCRYKIGPIRFLAGWRPEPVWFR